MRENLSIATRQSPLAQVQAGLVQKALQRLNPRLQSRFLFCQTRGDRLLDHPLAALGGKGLFTKEVDRAVLERQADLAVHSLKDMPAALPEGIIIAAFLKRGAVADCLVSRSGHNLSDLPSGSIVGTSSLRRRALLLRARPDLRIVPLRGNVQLRLQKLDQKTAQATVLAKAGLERLGLSLPADILDPAHFYPAPCQGIIALTCRKDDTDLRAGLRPLNDIPTELQALAERTFLADLNGDCRTPLGGYCFYKAGAGRKEFCARAFLSLPDGTVFLEAAHRILLEPDDTDAARKAARNLGHALAADILRQKPQDFQSRLESLLEDAYKKPPPSDSYEAKI